MSSDEDTSTCEWDCYLCNNKCKLATTNFSWKNTFEAALFLIHTSKKGVEKRSFAFSPNDVGKYLTHHVDLFPNLKEAIAEDEIGTKQKARSVLSSKLGALCLNKNYANIFGQVVMQIKKTKSYHEYFLKLKAPEVLHLFEFDKSFDTSSIPNYHDESVKDTPETYFEVEEILDSRDTEDEKGNKVTLYLVKWKGYNGEDTWEPYKSVFHTNAYKTYIGQEPSSEETSSDESTDKQQFVPSESEDNHGASSPSSSSEKPQKDPIFSLAQNLDQVSLLPRRKGFKYSPKPYKHKSGTSRVPIVVDEEDQPTSRTSPRKRKQAEDTNETEKQTPAEPATNTPTKRGRRKTVSTPPKSMEKDKPAEPADNRNTRELRSRTIHSPATPPKQVATPKSKPTEPDNSVEPESQPDKDHPLYRKALAEAKAKRTSLLSTPSFIQWKQARREWKQKHHTQSNQNDEGESDSPGDSEPKENATSSPSPPQTKKEKSNAKTPRKSPQDPPSTPKTRSASRAEEASKQIKKTEDEPKQKEKQSSQGKKRSASVSPAPKTKKHKKRRKRYSVR